MKDERRPAKNAAATIAAPDVTTVGGHPGSAGGAISKPVQNAVEALIAHVVDQVTAQLGHGNPSTSPWLTRPAAAEYLGDVPISRLEKDRTIPCHRWEGRVLYNRAELDEWLRAL